MALTGFEFLKTTRITAIVQTLASRLENQQPLVFLNRTPSVDAEDDEIIAQYKGNIFVADIITDDAAARVVQGGQITTQTTNIPNIKLGQRIGQNMMKRLSALARNQNLEGDNTIFTGWQMNMATNLVIGLRQRVNILCAMMQIDAMTNDSFGVKISAGWGMPSSLKVTPSTTWDDPASTPISDLQNVALQVAPDTYGETYNRATMSTVAFRYMTQSTEFQNRAKLFFRFNFGTGAFGTSDLGQMRTIFEAVTGLQLELTDSIYWTENADGTKSSARVLPANKVILSNTNDDNDPTVMDWANGIVGESVISALVDNGPTGLNGETFGPVAYYLANPSYNPPSIECWAVMRGFPRKFRETATSVLTVGTF